MNEPARFEFFCSELDYPKFLALFPDKFLPTYLQFVARVDERIAKRAESIGAIEKASVSYLEFIAECERRRETPNYHRLMLCAHQVWGRSNGFHPAG